jgi:hypothetical protein
MDVKESWNLNGFVVRYMNWVREMFLLLNEFCTERIYLLLSPIILHLYYDRIPEIKLPQIKNKIYT